MSLDLFTEDARADAVVEAAVEVVDDGAEFFAPAPSDMFDNLLAQYQGQRTKIAQVTAWMTGPVAADALHWFLSGNATEERGRSTLTHSAAQLFDEAGAVKALDATYWSKALALTDVLDAMPQARRNDWSKQIMERTCPEFTADTVRATLLDLLNMRGTFFAERVDGIFRGLSGEHVTNAPEAFGKRMIIARVLTCYDTTDHERCGLINDLRCVIAKFMGRDEPSYAATEPLVRALKSRWGEWVTIDGGALRIRLYKKGTAHLEVHPDMAWRLNGVLANLYPAAIPAKFRQRPKRQGRETVPVMRPLPFRVVEALGSVEEWSEPIKDDWRGGRRRVPNTVYFRYRPAGEYAGTREEAGRVLEALGGVPVKVGGLTYWQFDFYPFPVISEVSASGCMPDERAHQFYPTPRALAERVVELAAIPAGAQVLEPSAGLGGLADLLPKETTTCVELSPLHCSVLEAKGLRTVRADFIEWAQEQHGAPFSRVVMNPPFQGGRARSHLEHAAALLSPGGRLVAVLPAGMRGKDDVLPGYRCEWSEQIDNAFPGVSASVAILTATRAE